MSARFYLVGRLGEGILLLSKYGWSGETVTRKASSFSSAKLAQQGLRRAAKWREPPPACVVVEGARPADVLFSTLSRVSFAHHGDPCSVEGCGEPRWAHVGGFRSARHEFVQSKAYVDECAAVLAEAGFDDVRGAA